MESAPELPRSLSLLDAASIVAGTVIGSAIFLVPSQVAAALPDARLIVLVWVATGVLSFFGALAYAELGAMMPSTGGQYVYLRAAYGPLCAFLCGWAFFLIIESGGIATLAVGFSIYLGYFIPLTPWASRLVSVGLIVVLTWVSCRGAREGAALQNLFTFLKLAGLGILICGAFLAKPAAAVSNPPFTFHTAPFGAAMVACLWAYEGWNCVSFVAGEVRNPQRNLPRALGLGTGGLVVLYVVANLAYLRILGVAQLAGTSRVASTVAERALGHPGAVLVAITILISIAGATNGSILSTPRIYFAQARDGLFFRSVASVHPRYQTPWVSIILHSGWAALLALTDSYQTLFSFVIFGAWLFYGLTVFGVIILRRRDPHAVRPYKMWGYPLTPLLFAATSFWFVVNTMITTPRPSIIGLAIIGSGIPVYYIWKRCNPTPASERYTETKYPV
jgi:APA family basic amino acid/polyamine antiporter